MENDISNTLGQAQSFAPVALAITGAILFLGFLPAIAAVSQSRGVLILASILLSLSAVAVLFGSGLLGLGGVVLWPIGAGCWFGGLLCGLAAYVDAAQERRDREMTYRLLHNDARYLRSPAILKAADKYEDKPPRFT